MFGIGMPKPMPGFLYGYQPKKLFTRFFSVQQVVATYLSTRSQNKKSPFTTIIVSKRTFCLDILNFLRNSFFAFYASAGSRASDEAFFLDGFFAILANTVSTFVDTHQSFVDIA